MFENKTFETILSEMLGYVSERNPELDTRTGSIIYTALAPMALELEATYREMDMILDETFLETASREYLTKHGDQHGVSINEATYGLYVGEFDVEVPIGSRFNLDKFNYVVVEFIREVEIVDEDDPENITTNYQYKLLCETAGSEPNSHYGSLTPISFVDGLTFAQIPHIEEDDDSYILKAGEDEEDTEAFRYRLQVHLKNPPVDGNVAQYNEWLDEYEGVGKYKVVPQHNGLNTVKLLVLDSEGKPIDDITDIQDHFDPVGKDASGNRLPLNDDPTNATYPQGRGMGNGKAPIGAIVTVSTPEAYTINVSLNINYKEGYDENDDKLIKDALNQYCLSTAFERTTVDYMEIFAEVYSCECVAQIREMIVEVIDSTGVLQETLSPEGALSYNLNDDEVVIFPDDGLTHIS